jgi:hypothetical protein
VFTDFQDTTGSPGPARPRTRPAASPGQPLDGQGQRRPEDVGIEQVAFHRLEDGTSVSAIRKCKGRRLGRRRTTSLPAGAALVLTVRQAAALWSCSRSTAARRLAKGDLPALGQPPKPADQEAARVTRFGPDQAVGQTGVCPGS